MTTLAPVPMTEMSDALLEGMAGTPLFEGASQATISRLDLLHAAGCERAKIFVLAVDDPA